MRTAKILAVMMLCAAVPAATNAQSTLTSVMDDFVKSHSNKEVKTATYLEYDENDSSDTRKPSTFHYEYDFNLPATDNKKSATCHSQTLPSGKKAKADIT